VAGAPAQGQLTEPEREGRFAALMAALGVLRWAPLEPGDVELYARLTQAVPITLLEAGATAWVRERDRFPTPHQLLEACELARVHAFRELRASRYPPCGKCSAAGWIEKEIEGVRRAMKCPCVQAYQKACERLGWPKEPLALPVAGPEEGVE
jgi:hypothetical protein